MKDGFQLYNKQKLSEEYPNMKWDKYLMIAIIEGSSFYITCLNLDTMDFEILGMREMLKNYRLKIENKVYVF